MGLARLQVNFFQPVQKLVSKHRDAACVRRVEDRAQTPFQRLVPSVSLAPAARAALETLYQSLTPPRAPSRARSELYCLWGWAAP